MIFSVRIFWISAIILLLCTIIIICVLHLYKRETIYDEKSKNVVKNLYRKDILVRSSMLNENGTLIYKLVYRNGNIARSKSYDKNGSLKIKQTFYDDGQVHFRTEYRKGGKHTSEFDHQGQII